MIRLSDHFTYGRLIRFSIPSIIMMIFSSMYTTVDGIFVSNLVGASAFASLNLIFPVIGMIGAFGFMIGTGGSALISKTMGEDRQERANEYFTMLVVFEVLVGLAVSLVVLPFIGPISAALGAIPDLMDDCITYGFILAAGQPFFFLQASFQSFLVVAEKPKYGLYVVNAKQIDF